MANLSANLEKFLRTAKTKWQEEATRAKEESAYGRLEDGRYIARLTEAEFTESKSTSRPQVVWTFTILEGDNAGETVKSFRGLDGDDALKWFSKDLMIYGVDPDDVILDTKQSSDDMFFINVLESLAEERPVVKLRLKTNSNDYQAVNVEGLIEDYEGNGDLPEKEEKKAPAKRTTAKVEEKQEKKAPAKKTAKKPDPEPDPEPEEVEEEEEVEDVEEDVELAVGMKVQFTWKGEVLEGVVKEILEDENKIKVKVGNKIYPVKADDESLELLENEVDE